VLKLSKYFLFQAFGWSAFALFNIYVAYILQELTFKIFLTDILLSLIGFGISHLYRNYLKKHQWIVLETEQLIKKALLATIIPTIVYYVGYHLLILILAIRTQDEYFSSFIATYLLLASWNLIYFAWHFIEKNKRIQIDTLKMESSLKDLEIITIRANLQPHFIFNSLNSIRALIDENPELARNAITKISNILRNTITKQDPTDTLENELALVEDYLALEKIRFEERLDFKKEVDVTALSIPIPTMMLQTLIENAIKHGISSLEAGGNIFLSAKITPSKQLEIQITNDTDSKQEIKKENNLGFGLNSTKQRLKLIYGDKAGFSFESNNNKAKVLISIPLLPDTTNKNI
jgi:two-component system LytT family sensor kinase